MIRVKNKAKPRTRNALLYASIFLLPTDRGLEKRIEDGVHACCIARVRCASGTCMRKRACDERSADLECCSGKWGVFGGLDAVGGGGWRVQWDGIRVLRGKDNMNGPIAGEVAEEAPAPPACFTKRERRGVEATSAEAGPAARKQAFRSASFSQSSQLLFGGVARSCF
jgi:hypothetical protein